MERPEPTAWRSREYDRGPADLDRIMACARADRAALAYVALCLLWRALSWPVRVTLIRPFRMWRRRERIRTGLAGMGDALLHDIGVMRDQVPYLIAREDNRDAA